MSRRRYRLVQVGDHWEEESPDVCPNGHPLGPNQVLVGWLPCTDCGEGPGAQGHRTWRCRECGETIYDPPHEG